jgi:hypothetical protein
MSDPCLPLEIAIRSSHTKTHLTCSKYAWDTTERQYPQQHILDKKQKVRLSKHDFDNNLDSE